MEVFVLVILVVASAAGGAWAMFEYLANTAPERERALRTELEALQATQRLSIAAWQARQAMADEARRHSGNGD